MAKHEEKKFAAGIKKMTSDEIGTEVKNLRDKLFTLRSQSVTEKVEDHSQFGITKRNIARLMTEQSSRRITGKGEPRTHAPVKKAASGAKAKKAPTHGKKAAVHSHARVAGKKATKAVKAAPKRKAAKTAAKAKAKSGAKAK